MIYTDDLCFFRFHPPFDLSLLIGFSRPILAQFEICSQRTDSNLLTIPFTFAAVAAQHTGAKKSRLGADNGPNKIPSKSEDKGCGMDRQTDRLGNFWLCCHTNLSWQLDL